MIDDLTSVGGWSSFSDAEHYNGEIDFPPRQAGSPTPGVYFLPPNAAAILLSDGFWEEINSELGTLLDRAEEEELSPPLSARIAQKILALAQSRYREGPIKKVVGWREPERRPIWAEIQAPELAKLLAGLANFLMDASRQGKVIIASL